MEATDELPRGTWRKARRPFLTCTGRPVSPGTLLQIMARDREGQFILFTEAGASVVLSRASVRRHTRAHDPAGVAACSS